MASPTLAKPSGAPATLGDGRRGPPPGKAPALAPTTPLVSRDPAIGAFADPLGLALPERQRPQILAAGHQEIENHIGRTAAPYSSSLNSGRAAWSARG
jgi:hypothetical protein